MNRSLCLATLILGAAFVAFAQEPGNSVTPPPTGNTPLQQQKNASSANQDTSATTGDQITKPGAAKGSTLTGCLSGPDQQGKFILRSMSYRTGVEILGPANLKDDSGSKVRLTGQWEPAKAPSQDQNTTQLRRFQVTDVEVVAAKCHAPSETTPVSKEKKGKTTVYNAPSADDGK